MYQTSFVIHFYTPYMYTFLKIYLWWCEYNNSQSYYLKYIQLTNFTSYKRCFNKKDILDSQSYYLKCIQLTNFTSYLWCSNGKSYIRLSQSQKCTKLPLWCISTLLICIPFWKYISYGVIIVTHKAITWKEFN